MDGKSISAQILNSITSEIQELKAKRGINPGLAVVLVGDDPASSLYVKNKENACIKVGITSRVLRLTQDVSENCLIDCISELNADSGVHGILVQLPLPKHIDQNRIINCISHKKDVDGFHPLNAGKLMRGEDCFEPCTPKGIMKLIGHTGLNLSGKSVCVIGRSNIVGKPISLMLLNNNATVTICHSKTPNLAQYAGSADVLVAAIGKSEMIDDTYIKSGAIVIDVGINKVGTKLVGDVNFQKAYGKASWITPVPGGVGPMTIAMLLENTLISAKKAGL